MEQGKEYNKESKSKKAYKTLKKRLFTELDELAIDIVLSANR